METDFLSSPERRAAPRKPLQGRIVLVLAQGAQLMGRALDVNASAMGGAFDADIPLRTEATAHFQIPGKDGLFKPAQGRVKVVQSTLSRHSGGFRVALEFVNPSTALLDQIEGYVRR
jgi:hypothetical protein